MSPVGNRGGTTLRKAAAERPRASTPCALQFSAPGPERDSCGEEGEGRGRASCELRGRAFAVGVCGPPSLSSVCACLRVVMAQAALSFCLLSMGTLALLDTSCLIPYVRTSLLFNPVLSSLRIYIR